MSEQTREPEGKLTRFRPDRRVQAARVGRTLALLGMLACVLFGIWRYQDELTPAHFKRLYQYLTAGNEHSDFSEYAFESGLNTVYAPFGRGLAVASGDTFYFVSGLGGTRFSVQLKYADPRLSAGERYVLAYDLGGYGLRVLGSYAEYLELTLESPILSAQMNKEGDFAVVTNERGYRAAVTVFDGRQRQVCKWSTGRYYIRTASVSPDGTRFAALCLEQSGLSTVSSAHIFAIGEEEPQAVIDLGSARVYAMCHDKYGALVILCDDGLRYYGPDGESLGTLSFTAAPTLFAMQEGESPLLAFPAADGSGQRTELLAAGENAAVLWRARYDGALRAIARAGERAAALLGERLLLREGEHTYITQAEGARAVLLQQDGTPILIYSDRAEKISLEDAQWTP